MKSMSKILVKVVEKSLTAQCDLGTKLERWLAGRFSRTLKCLCSHVCGRNCGRICSFLEFFLTGGTKRYVHFNVIMVLTQNIGKYVEESCYFCSVLLGVN